MLFWGCILIEDLVNVILIIFFDCHEYFTHQMAVSKLEAGEPEYPE